jgi:cbb3-type cytochrome oxidase subunit 3
MDLNEIDAMATLIGLLILCILALAYWLFAKSDFDNEHSDDDDPTERGMRYYVNRNNIYIHIFFTSSMIVTFLYFIIVKLFE